MVTACSAIYGRYSQVGNGWDFGIISCHSCDGFSSFRFNGILETKWSEAEWSRVEPSGNDDAADDVT